MINFIYKKNCDFMIVENFLELIDIDDIVFTDEYVNMVDIAVEDDESFLLSNGIISHNSAGESSRNFRNSSTQAIYKLRGKFMNTTKMPDKRIIQDEKGRPTEAANLMSSIGLELNKPLNVENLRFGEILICCDMDCLEENTLIKTEEGIKKIKDITINDKVLTHTNEYKKVKQIIKTEKSNHIEIWFGNEKIKASANHKIFINRDGNIIETEVKNIIEGDSLLLKNNNISDKTTLEDYDTIKIDYLNHIFELATFYDIEVEEDNTFHIYLENSDSYILSHNCDGDSITGLLINFFARWKELFELGMIYRVITPLLVIKKGKNIKYFYTTEEWNDFQNNNSLNGWAMEFKKGLGSLEDYEYSEMINSPKKMKINWDDNAQKMLDAWFGEDTELRKTLLS